MNDSEHAQSNEEHTESENGVISSEEILHLKDLFQDPVNARAHNERNLGMLVDALREVGAARSGVIDEDGRILAGNLTWEALAEAGIEKVRVVKTQGDEWVVVQREGLSEEQKRRLALFDNRTAEIATWDPEALLELVTQDEDILAGLWSPAEIEELLGDITGGDGDGGGAEAPVDRAEELLAKWGVQRGQVWRAGRHRVSCGDATEPADVAKLMDGGDVQLVWTDPPYGVRYGEQINNDNPMHCRVRTITNDDLTGSELEELIRAAYRNVAAFAVPGAAIYATCPQGPELGTALRAFEKSGFTFHWQLVWVKDQFVFGRADYHFRHENILYGWKPGAAHYFIDERTHDSVFEVERPKASDEHPIMKPVDLIQRMVENSSRHGDAVVDPFCGAGATLVACERTGRSGYGMDIEPKYVAVTLERLEKMGILGIGRVDA